jgi:hypothetical protein
MFNTCAKLIFDLTGLLTRWIQDLHLLHSIIELWYLLQHSKAERYKVYSYNKRVYIPPPPPPFLTRYVSN